MVIMMDVIIAILVFWGLIIYTSFKTDSTNDNHSNIFSNSKKKKPSLFDKEADAHGLTEEEKKIAKEQGYDVWDFEEDDDEDSYYSDN